MTFGRVQVKGGIYTRSTVNKTVYKTSKTAFVDFHLGRYKYLCIVFEVAVVHRFSR